MSLFIHFFYSGDLRADRNSAGLSAWFDCESGFIFLGHFVPGVGLKSIVNAGLQVKTRMLQVYILNHDCWIQLICRLLFLLDPTSPERWSPASLVPGRERVKPSIPRPSLKLFSAQQCAHACHAVIVFFSEVTFHLYLKNTRCLSVSLSSPATHPLLSVGTLMKYAFIKAHRNPLTRSTDDLITRRDAGEPAADSVAYKRGVFASAAGESPSSKM